MDVWNVGANQLFQRAELVTSITINRMLSNVALSSINILPVTFLLRYELYILPCYHWGDN